MKTISFLTALCLLSILSMAQDATITLTFTGVDFTSYTQIDSIRVLNKTQGNDTVLIWPDTVLVLDYFTEISEPVMDSEKFMILQNFPNPCTDKTNIMVFVPARDRVEFVISDQMGRILLLQDWVLDRGYHMFSLDPGNDPLLFITGKCYGQQSTVKVIHTPGSPDESLSLKYLSSIPYESRLKKTHNLRGFTYYFGDKLIFTGYRDSLKSGIMDSPVESKAYSFQFAYSLPCPEEFTVTWEGKTYNTIQIFSQCWLKENLDVGKMIHDSITMTNNGIIEKYCYDNDTANCEIFGGLYLWNEIMQYTSQEGAQGICPPGWHVATDDDWKMLEGASDSLYSFGDPEWDMSQMSRGYDADYHLKYTSIWPAGDEGDDWYLFSGLPGGLRSMYTPYFMAIYSVGTWWTSSSYGASQKWNREIRSYEDGMFRWHDSKLISMSVRCIRDE